MKSNQQQYIEYIKWFAEETKCHIWLSGSFSNGTATMYSDVDLSVYCNTEHLNRLIYGYGKPVYISYTHKPFGILIIIYEDGVAVDLEIVEKIDVTDIDFFHTGDIQKYNYSRNETLCKEFLLRDDMPYQISRLFHRSLIKFLSGKKDIAINIANEIALYNNCNSFIDEKNYRNSIVELLKVFNEQYQLPLKYYTILCVLIDELDEVKCLQGK